jgi:hypothetical protein
MIGIYGDIFLSHSLTHPITTLTHHFTLVLINSLTHPLTYSPGGKLASTADRKLLRTADAVNGKEFLELRVREPLALVVTAYRKPDSTEYQVGE